VSVHLDAGTYHRLGAIRKPSRLPVFLSHLSLASAASSGDKDLQSRATAPGAREKGTDRIL
jgi:hypothetical protein